MSDLGLFDLLSVDDTPPEPTGPTAADLRKRIGALLSNCGTPGTCKGCGAQIYWLQHRNGRNTPYTPEGLNHFADCPQAKRFKR